MQLLLYLGLRNSILAKTVGVFAFAQIMLHLILRRANDSHRHMAVLDNPH